MKLTKVFGIVLSLHVGVILLVMFQPSCQTTGGSSKVQKDSQDVLPEESSDQTFNQGLIEGDETEPSVSNTSEFSAPQRPQPGELTVPQEPKPSEVTPAVIVPSESPSAPVELKPTNISIYNVVRGDTLWGIARKNGVSLADLLNANPNFDKSGRLSIGQEIIIPGVANASSQPKAMRIDSPEISPTDEGTYTIEKGDTLSRIARKHNIRLSELLKANNMSMSSIIRPGQRLSIPGGTQVAVDQEVVPTRTVPPGASTHVVKKGENLSRISSIYGISVSQIMEWNGLSNPSLIRAGQPLIVSQASDLDTSPPAQPIQVEQVEDNSADPSGSLQDFFNDSSNDDRPIIDAP